MCALKCVTLSYFKSSSIKAKRYILLSKYIPSLQILIVCAILVKNHSEQCEFTNLICDRPMHFLNLLPFISYYKYSVESNQNINRTKPLDLYFYLNPTSTPHQISNRFVQKRFKPEPCKKYPYQLTGVCQAPTLFHIELCFILL